MSTNKDHPNRRFINTRTVNFSRPTIVSLVSQRNFLTEYAYHSNRVYEQGVCIVVTHKQEPDLICVNPGIYRRLVLEDRASSGKISAKTSVSISKEVTVRQITRGFLANVRHPLKFREVEAVVLIRRRHPAIAFLPIRAFDRVPAVFLHLTRDLGYKLDNAIFD